MAEEYGKALFSLAEELSLTERVLEEVNTVSLVLKENPEYSKIQDSPAIAAEEKTALIENAFGGAADILKNLLKILAVNRGFHLIFDIVKEYEALYNESRGICTAQIITARPLDEQRLERIIRTLEEKTGMTVKAKATVDESLIGGIKLRYLGREVDGSIKAKLSNMEKSLKSAIV